MTQITMDLEKKPSQLTVDEVLEKYPKLADLPRVGWRNKKAWYYKAKARKFLLTKGGHTYLVDQGGRAVDLCHPGTFSTHAVKLLDPDKRNER